MSILFRVFVFAFVVCPLIQPRVSRRCRQRMIDPCNVTSVVVFASVSTCMVRLCLHLAENRGGDEIFDVLFGILLTSPVAVHIREGQRQSDRHWVKRGKGEYM